MIKLPQNKGEFIKLVLASDSTQLNMLLALINSHTLSVMDKWFLDNWSWLKDVGLTMERHGGHIGVYLDNSIVYHYCAQDQLHIWLQAQEILNQQG